MLGELSSMQFLKYIVAGVINTVIGYGVFLTLFRLLYISAEYANAFGACAGLASAFVLNRLFVFNKPIFNHKILLKFLSAFLVAFLINQFVLIILYRIVGLNAETAQIFAMISYSIFFYFLNKNFVFHDGV